jgi:hypothetical protein
MVANFECASFRMLLCLLDPLIQQRLWTNEQRRIRNHIIALVKVIGMTCATLMKNSSVRAASESFKVSYFIHSIVHSFIHSFFFVSIAYFRT